MFPHVLSVVEGVKDRRVLGNVRSYTQSSQNFADLVVYPVSEAVIDFASSAYRIVWHTDPIVSGSLNFVVERQAFKKAGGDHRHGNFPDISFAIFLRCHDWKVRSQVSHEKKKRPSSRA